MGGQYKITGGKYPRMRPVRRRGRVVFAAVACVTVLGVLGWGTLQLIDVFTGGDKASAAGAAGCATPAKASASPSAPVLPKPGQVTVNVLNATTRSGLAQKTADELKKRGFRVGEVSNAPAEYDKKVTGTGLLLGPAASVKTSLTLLGTQLPGAEHRTEAARKGAAVDLIIGDGFKGLAKPADADAALAGLTAPQPTPTAQKKSC
ncbi:MULTISPECIES: LytR C-terminal domain-containing protein [Streptomyces]|uniref:LytR C-terminal domain-containing protein n=1 Tax=Streptomyces ardesiacus TaxID=285564 RepID=A0ABW8HIW5_9ACTN|nr:MULTISPECIES: LytR C-terminal domain-containing protein [Streptomyces]KOT92342.1 membrane protein [Streptomyces sp. NRRL F-4711]KOX50768.1 membrane protein [Streptomyces sp. NRRL F-7442]MCL7369955.1 LytR C-terminal domain-containing protein [Streptomyces ardesiacus]NEB61964.1 LytR C-terminal domain-containing protein [Streptomyces diastaticus]